MWMHGVCLPGRRLIKTIGIIRTRRDFHLIKRPAQHARIQHALKILKILKIPPESLLPHRVSAPSEFLHLATAHRRKFRTVTSVKIPGEKKMVRLKRELAATHGTATAVHCSGST
jgi:hypothetical protein